MRIGYSFLAVTCVSLLGGCMISEQIGQMPQDLTIHFDTDFNRILLFGRSAAVAAFAFWVFSSWGKKNTVAIIVGVAALGVAGWLFVKDYPALTKYRVEVRGDGLVLNIPPDPEAFIAWSSIDGMALAGYEWMNVPTPGVSTPFVPKPEYAWSQLPDWETMDIVADGVPYHINLKKLSIEQRQILSRAIVQRGQLIKE